MGLTIVRAMVSAMIRKLPPTSIAAGIVLLWSVPTRILTVCGITSPTNPTRPARDTQYPVISPVRISHRYLFFSGSDQV